MRSSEELCTLTPPASLSSIRLNLESIWMPMSVHHESRVGSFWLSVMLPRKCRRRICDKGPLYRVVLIEMFGESAVADWSQTKRQENCTGVVDVATKQVAHAARRVCAGRVIRLRQGCSHAHHTYPSAFTLMRPSCPFQCCSNFTDPCKQCQASFFAVLTARF